MKLTRPITIALATAALAAGVAGGLALGPAGASPTEPATSADAMSAVAAAGRCGTGLAELAEVVGIPADDLRAALRDGQTLAEVAEANGVERQAVVDALVAGGTARIDAALEAGRIDQARADERAAALPDRAAALVDGELERSERPRARRAARARGRVAEAIGIPADDLRAALRDGQTIAEVAEANGVEPEAVVDTLVGQAGERLTAVVNGDVGRC